MLGLLGLNHHLGLSPAVLGTRDLKNLKTSLTKSRSIIQGAGALAADFLWADIKVLRHQVRCDARFLVTMVNIGNHLTNNYFSTPCPLFI